MFEYLTTLFSYKFMMNALVVGSLVALCAALLGISLVLRRYSMIGDGLSHVGFGALAIASVMNAAPLAVAVPVVMAAAFLLLRMTDNGKLKGDAAIALISTGALAIGIIIISLNGSNIDISNYLIGSILAIGNEEVGISIALSVLVLVLYFLCYNRIFAITFDESFAKATGVRTELYNALTAALTAVTVVLGMRLVGTLLISSFIIFPPLTAMRVCKNFRSVTICTSVVAVLCFVTGLIVSSVLDMPAGATVVAINLAAFLLMLTVGAIKKS